MMASLGHRRGPVLAAMLLCVYCCLSCAAGLSHHTHTAAKVLRKPKSGDDDLPAQGFEGQGVKHEDGKTHTGDWGNEYPESTHHTDEVKYSESWREDQGKKEPKKEEKKEKKAKTEDESDESFFPKMPKIEFPGSGSKERSSAVKVSTLMTPASCSLLFLTYFLTLSAA